MTRKSPRKPERKPQPNERKPRPPVVWRFTDWAMI
jgi:hypothetical protein